MSGTEKQFDIIRRYSIAFLEKHAAEKTDSDHILERSDPMLTRYVKEPVAGVPWFPGHRVYYQLCVTFYILWD
jgi:hypothetical protein